MEKALIKEMGDTLAFSQIFSRSVAQNGRALSHWLRADGGSSPPGSVVSRNIVKCSSVYVIFHPF